MHPSPLKPIKMFRLGNIDASIWEAEGNAPNRFSVKIARIHWEDQEWKHSILFRDEELLILSKIASDAYSWICEHQDENGEMDIDSPRP